jgi:hypothetical protein
MGLSKMGSSCLQIAAVTGNNLVPLPPAKIMPFMDLFLGELVGGSILEADQPPPDDVVLCDQ